MSGAPRGDEAGRAPLPPECADFASGPAHRLVALLGGYGFRASWDVRDLAVDPVSSAVFAVGEQLVAWDPRTGARRAAFPVDGQRIAIDPRGGLAAVGAGAKLRIVDLASGATSLEKYVAEGDEGAFARKIVPRIEALALAGGIVAVFLETAKRVQVFRADGERLCAFEGSGPLAVSPDGGLVAAPGGLFDPRTGGLLLSFPAGRAAASFSAVDRVSFSPDGRWLARATGGGEVERWDVAALRAGAGVGARTYVSLMPVPPWEKEGKPEAAASVIALPDGRVVTSTGTEVQIWSDGAIAEKLPFRADALCLGAGATVWGVRQKRTIAGLDLATGAATGQEGHLGPVRVVAYSPRAPLALTGSEDSRVLLWHLASGTVLRELRNAWGGVVGAGFFPDGRRVAAIDKDAMFVWDAATSALVAKLPKVSPRTSGLKDNVDLDVSPDGRHALVCTHSDHVLLWNAESQETIYCREVQGVRSAAFGEVAEVAVLGGQKELLVFDLQKGEVAARAEVEPDGLRFHAHFVLDGGRRALRACTGRGLFVYDLGTGARRRVELTDDVHQVLAVSPDGRRAAVTTSDDPTLVRPVVRPVLTLVDLADGRRISVSLASAADEPTSAAFSGDGRSLLVGTARGVVLVFELTGGAQVSAAIPAASPAPAAAPASALGGAPAPGAPPGEEPKTQVMSAFPEMPAAMARPSAAPSGFPATARSGPSPASATPAPSVVPPGGGDRVVVAPIRAPSQEEGPMSSLHPLGTTSPRAGAGPSSSSPGSVEAKREEAIAILKRVGALYARGAYNEALAFAAPLRKYLFDSFPPGDPLIASAVANLAELHTKVGELREAEALHQEAVARVAQSAGAGSEAFAMTLSNAGNFALESGEIARAEELHRRALEIRRLLHGERHPLTAQSTGSLGFVFSKLGRPDRAEPLYRAALEAFHATVGASHPEYAKTLHNLGVLLGQSGRLAESEGALAQSLSLRRQVLPAGHPELAQGLASLGTLYLVSQRPAQAEPHYREALELSRRALGDDAIETSTRAVDLAVALRALGRGAESIPLLTRALEVRAAKLPVDDPRVANVRRMLGELGARV